MKTAAVITNGRSQSVELPEGFHIDGTEVYVKQVGRSIMLIPKEADTPNEADPWRSLIESLDLFSDDFMEDRAQPPHPQP